MDLIPFSEFVLKKIKGAPIYFVGRSEPYWEELCSEYEVFPFLVGAFDSASRNQGVCQFHGKGVSVYGFDEFSLLPHGCIILLTDDYYLELYEKLKKIKNIRENFSEIYYFINRETRYALYYKDIYKEKPLREMVVFRSGPHASGYIRGMDFADNARALFEYMLREHFDELYEIVWVVHNPVEYADRYAEHPNVKFLPFDGAVSDDEELRNQYYEALCLAKYIFFTDAYGFARNTRSDQVRVQLWHGCGIKRRVFFSPCEKRYEYTTVISRMYAEIHVRDYGLRWDQVLVTGYPKNDWIYHPINNWKEMFGIPKARKYIFWLPTFRTTETSGLNKLNEGGDFGETGLPIVTSLEMLEDLNREMEQKNCIILIKLHPFQKRALICQCELSHVRFLENDDLLQNDVQINQLLGHADALISDYSSVAVDYTLLDRPIAFTLNDYEIYGNSRGFNWPNVRDYLPGEEIFTYGDFLSFVQGVIRGEDRSREKRNALCHRFHAYLDDRSSERVLRALGIKK